MLTALSCCLWCWPWVDLMLGGSTWPSSSPYCRTSSPSFTPPRHASRDRFVNASRTASLELDFLESGSGMQHCSCRAGDVTAQTRSSWGHSHALGQCHWRKGAATSRHQWHHPLHREERLDQAGHLDMFLGCIAKALTVQLKAKGTTIVGTAGMAAGKGVTTVTLPMIFNSRSACLHVPLSNYTAFGSYLLNEIQYLFLTNFGQLIPKIMYFLL